MQANRKMRIIKNILITLIIVISNQVYSCDCKDLGPLDSLRIISYNFSDLVFLGELVDIDTMDFSYTFKIIELYKGEIKTELIKGKYFDSCSSFPKEKCKWIVYANIRSTNVIDINGCLASRSELHPFCNGCFTPPRPLRPDATRIEIEKAKQLKKEILENAKKEWFEEIEILRKKNVK